MRKLRIGLCLLCKSDVIAVLQDDEDEVDYIDTSLGCKHTVMVETVPYEDEEDEELTEDDDIEDGDDQGE